MVNILTIFILFKLDKTHTYSGTTTISAGTLQIGAGSTSGSLSSSTSITNNANIVFNRSDSLTVSNAISGTGNLTQAGAGTLILTGNNGYTGTTTINAGTLQIGSAGLLGGGVMQELSAITDLSSTRAQTTKRSRESSPATERSRKTAPARCSLVAPTPTAERPRSMSARS